MKRTIVGLPATGDDDHKMKRIKHDDDVVKREEEEEEEEKKEVKETGFTNPNSTTMKRTIVGPPATGGDDHKTERIKHDDDVVKGEEEKELKETGFTNLHESLLFEVLKHVDAKTLATAGCVSKQWHKTAQDERLWELICTRSAHFGCDYKQLRSVVLALGGFRRLHSLGLWQLSRHPSGSGSNWAPLPMIGSKSSARWGRDEVHLSLSLLSIRYYEDMNSSKRN